MRPGLQVEVLVRRPLRCAVAKAHVEEVHRGEPAATNKVRGYPPQRVEQYGTFPGHSDVFIRSAALAVLPNDLELSCEGASATSSASIPG